MATVTGDKAPAEGADGSARKSGLIGKMISQKSSIDYWQRVSETVNYDGYSEWYRAKGAARKTFWTIVMMGTVVAIIYYSYTVTMQYLARPAATQINDILVSGMPFPRVTICHSARFNRIYVQEKIKIKPEFVFYGFKPYDTDEKMLSDFIQWMAYVAYQPNNLTEQGPSLEFLYQYYFNRTASPYAMYDLVPFLEESGLSCQSFLKRCSFAAKPFDCCLGAETIWTDYGTCYQINIVGRDGSSSQSQPGSNGGLKVLVNVDRNEIPVGARDPDIGVRAYFSIDGVNPYDDPVYVPPNKHALIRLEATLYSFDQSTDNCTDHPPALFSVPYSLGTCANECMRNISFEKCGCKPLGYGVSISESEACPPRAMAECVLPLTMGFTTGSQGMEALMAQMNCAFNSCPKLCQQWVYTAYASYQDVVVSPYPQFPYDDPPQSNDVDSYVFTAFFGEIKYTQMKSAPLWDFNTFISNVGGLIGLWTGMSVITAMQILVYCYLVPCCYEEGKSPIFIVPEMWKSRHPQ